jgi:hypothetical protein
MKLSTKLWRWRFGVDIELDKQECVPSNVFIRLGYLVWPSRTFQLTLAVGERILYVDLWLFQHPNPVPETIRLAKEYLSA